ncbi:insulin-like growth factor-binding protein complex acid labile subunit [Limulus polyphemus]|uniref:Insulin-like growth factor-binding protein complex acid labile subunit n=1 Tax=Limulus polyphemus TaxID=6850 RepID=A0ABM1SE26_LIMPO|nr:insulin-like growth factor-binding protein complex acid labile subunit [Limulus polyphemus]XP_022241881.1 insulin-like growth factor-binding protein complex acid labile subunit [Limulus polyphemus]
MKNQGIIGICLILTISLKNVVFCLCPIRCQCNEEKLVVMCDGAGLDVVPITLNPDLRELHLARNSIKGIMTAFSVYHSLEYLDMTSNQLVALGRNNFRLQEKLHILLLGHNMISTLYCSTFDGLKGLRILKLTGNFIRELPDGIFVELVSLEVLDLSENSIDTISKDAFVGLGNLKILLLKDNKLGHVPSSSFGTLSHVLSIDLDLNNFPILPEDSFVNLANLEKLSLGSCGIRKIHKSAFKGLKNLLYLILQDNLLDSIPTEAFLYLRKLLELNLGQNYMKAIVSKSFNSLSNIQTITINSAPFLERIESEAFLPNIRLQNIIFNHNKKLSYIDRNAFSSFTLLRAVSLRGNNFQTFSEDVLPWSDLERFDLRDNPLICNCSLSWLLHHLQTRNYSESFDFDLTHIRCENPPVLRDLMLKGLSIDDLRCHEYQTQKILTWSFAAIGILLVALLVAVLWFRQRTVNDLKIKCSTVIPDSRHENRYRMDNQLRGGTSQEREWVVKIGRDPYAGRLV